jgi:hypothetical protein
VDLLAKAIEQYKIPAWPYEAAYDRIVVFSLPEDNAARDTYAKDGVIVKPESVRTYEQNQTPRGVIVSAGLGARDVLASHGIGLGHVVWVARLSPWRHEIDRDANGRMIEFLFLRVGDVVGSETLQGFIKEGAASVVREEGEHRVKFGDAAAEPRFDPPSYVA